MKHKSQWILILVFYPNLNSILPFAINTVWAEVKSAVFTNSRQKSPKTSEEKVVYVILEEEIMNTSNAKTNKQTTKYIFRKHTLKIFFSFLIKYF